MIRTLRLLSKHVLPKIYHDAPLIPGRRLKLPESTLHRLQVTRSDSCILFNRAAKVNATLIKDGSGSVWLSPSNDDVPDSELINSLKAQAQAEDEQGAPGGANGGKKNAKVWVAFGLVKQKQTRSLILQCTQLGCAGFLPFVSDHTIVGQGMAVDTYVKDAHYSLTKSLQLNIPGSEFWPVDVPDVNSKHRSPEARKNVVDKYIAEASGQSERFQDMPQVHPTAPNLQSLLNSTALQPKFEGPTLVLVCLARQPHLRLSTRLSSVDRSTWQNLVLVIGPEGGFSTRELRLLDTDKGWGRVSLGHHVLRTETAATAATAIAMDWAEETAVG